MAAQPPRDRRGPPPGESAHGHHPGEHEAANATPTPAGGLGHRRGHGGHRLMMIACCIPMLVLVIVLVATGAAGGVAIVFAVACLVMMALMMFAIPGDHRH